MTIYGQITTYMTKGWKNKTPLLFYSKNCHTLRRFPVPHEHRERAATQRARTHTQHTHTESKYKNTHTHTVLPKVAVELQLFETVILGRLFCTWSPQFCRMSSQIGRLRQMKLHWVMVDGQGRAVFVLLSLFADCRQVSTTMTMKNGNECGCALAPTWQWQLTIVHLPFFLPPSLLADGWFCR